MLNFIDNVFLTFKDAMICDNFYSQSLQPARPDCFPGQLRFRHGRNNTTTKHILTFKDSIINQQISISSTAWNIVVTMLSTALIIEDQAFSPSYDLATHPPLFRQYANGQHTGRLKKRDNLLTGEWGREGEGAKSYDGEKAWTSIL